MDMTQVRRELRKTGLPIFAELFLVSLFVMIDTAILKPCGTTAIAAVGLTAEPINLLEFSFWAVNTAVISLTAAKLAENSANGLIRMLVAYLKLCSVAVVLFAGLFAVLGEPVLHLFGARADTMPIALVYLRISLIGFIFRRLYIAVASVLKGAGAPQWSFALSLVANGLNVLFDILLVYGVGPFPEMGPAGAAMATGIGCLAAFALSIVVLRRQFGKLGLRVRLSDWLARSRADILDICRRTAPMLSEKIMIRIGVGIAVQRIALLGTAVFAAHRIVISLQNFAFLGFDAIATTTMIFISSTYVRRDEAGARAYIRGAMQYALGFAAICAALFLLIPAPLMRLYSNDPAVIGMGAHTLRLIVLFQPFQAAALLYASAMRGCELSRIPSVTTTIGIVVIRPILVYALTPFLGLYGAWLAISCDEIFRCVVLFVQRRRIWGAFAAKRV